jgi:hypothetical protein
MRKFYSTISTIIISFWPKLTELICDFIFVQNLDKKRWPARMLTSQQINDAMDNSTALVETAIAAYAKLQETANSANAQTAHINTKDANLKSFLQEGLPLQDVEDFYKKFANEREALDMVNTELQSWRNDLEMLLAKWSEEQKRKLGVVATDLVNFLRSQNISLTAAEEQELLSPSKNRSELITDLDKFYTEGWPKGFAKDAPIVNLRALWVIGIVSAYQKVEVTADKAFWKSLNKNIDKSMQDINKDAKLIKKECRELLKKLTKISQKISNEPIITPKQENQLREQLQALQAKAPGVQPAPTP